MGEAKLERVLNHLARHRIGIQWVGGEPTMNPLLYRVAPRAHADGIKQCLFTNGSLLHPKRVESLFDSHFVFIRVSLDAVTREVHQVHHGYRADRPYAERVLENLEQMVRRRRERGSTTMIGISVVVDERNLHDLVPTAHYIRRLCEEQGAGAIDYAIFRPTYQFYSAQLQVLPDTAARVEDLVRVGSEVEQILSHAGVRVIVPKDSFARADASVAADYGDACLAAGWFGEITPNGDMVVCSDRYGNPDYFIGNVAEVSVDAIWRGPRRRDVLAYAERSNCFKQRCPRNGRGFALNRVFHEVERFRRGDRLDEVRSWVADLRELLPAPEHSFFL
jgi:sulfatase maturation enzyme AslB (radical SAM superfamily)